MKNNSKKMKYKVLKKSTLLTVFGTIVGSLVLSACATTTNEDLGFHVTSTSMDNNHIFNAKVSLGSDTSPQLTWSKHAEAKAYAILMIDKDAAGTFGVPFAHWFAVINDANVTSMPEGASKDWSSTGSPMKDKFFQFQNMTTKKVTNTIIPTTFQKENAQAYFGPMPSDKDHLYEIQVFALKEAKAFPTSGSSDTTFVDFQQYIAQSKIAGIASLFGVGKQVKNGTDNQPLTFANDPEKTIKNGQFYKTLGDASKRIKDFKFAADSKVTGNPPSTPFLLPDDYVSMLSKNEAAVQASTRSESQASAPTEGSTGTSTEMKASAEAAKFSSKDSPGLVWNRYEGAKSYALFLNNSNQYSKWGAPVVNWVVWNIEQPTTGLTVSLAKGESTKTNTKIKQGRNSYSHEKFGSGHFSLLNKVTLANGTTQEGVAARSEMAVATIGAFLKQATGLGEQYFLPYHEGVTHHKGFYSFFLYALDVDGSQLSSSIKTQQDLMQAMNGHVLAISQLNFKLQKTVPAKTAA